MVKALKAKNTTKESLVRTLAERTDLIQIQREYGSWALESDFATLIISNGPINVSGDAVKSELPACQDHDVVSLILSVAKESTMVIGQGGDNFEGQSSPRTLIMTILRI